MKNIVCAFISFAILLLFPFPARAEESPPDYIATIGGTSVIRLGGESGEKERIDLDDLNLDLKASGGYLFHDFIEVGPTIFFEYGRSKEDPRSYSYTKSSKYRFEIGPYVFFYLYRSDWIRLYLGPAITFVFTEYERYYEYHSDTIYEEEGTGYAVHGFLGVNFFLTQNLALDVGANVGYSEIDLDILMTKYSQKVALDAETEELTYGLFLGLKYFYQRGQSGSLPRRSEKGLNRYIATVGATTGINFGGKYIDFDDYDHDELNLHFRTNVGYIFNNFFEVGPIFSIDYLTWNARENHGRNENEKTSFRFEIGPYAAFHLYRSNRMRFYLGPAVTFVFIHYKEETHWEYGVIQDELYIYEDDAYGYAVYGLMGVNLFLTKRLALDLGGRIGYSQVHHDTDDDWYRESERSDQVVYELFAGFKYFFDVTP